MAGRVWQGGRAGAVRWQGAVQAEAGSVVWGSVRTAANLDRVRQAAWQEVQCRVQCARCAEAVRAVRGSGGPDHSGWVKGPLSDGCRISMMFQDPILTLILSQVKQNTTLPSTSHMSAGVPSLLWATTSLLLSKTSEWSA